ncbi:MAG TPA: hydantoinase/oxoprolinase family protein [Thermodesulfobacteriota bacterium]|nr:hydantoinase/oxoprolinase family protein [Thermodesulfobacteriota bacterium]
MKYVVGVDTGGTFTDLICVDEGGEYIVIKTPSTPENPSLAVIESLRKAGAQLGKDLKRFLADVTRICHGTTVSTNTVLTWSGARVGLLCTKGFRDTLGIRFGIRETPYDYTIPAPKPLAPRYLRMPIEERIKWNGQELKSLNEEEVRKACQHLKEQRVQALVVGFVWSFKNPSHEKRAVDICKEELPGVYVIGSCDIQPEIREYWRISTAVLSAYVGPNLSHYLKYMVQTLNENGFKGELLITQSNAGVMFPEIAIEQAVRTILSGPACAPAAAAYIANPLDLRNLITVDMGGTSFDVCLIKDGQPCTALETAVAGVYHLRLPLIDVHTIGAGGGSIAWLDRMKILHVGPQSAGADPGPACYGRGGTEPTSTDADLLLGYLNPEYFLGGEMRVDIGLARKAITEKIADPLGMDVVDAARAVRKIIDHSMSDAISRVSVQRGEDPRRYTLVAAGGAGPVHVASLAKPLNIKQILIPKNSSIFCAIGSIIADLRHDLVRSVVAKTGDADVGTLNEVFRNLKMLGNGYLEREGIASKDRYYRKSIDMRYKGQFHEVELPISEAELSKEEIHHIIEDFHRKHEELYAYRDEVETEMINLRLAAFGKVVPPTRKAKPFHSQDPSKNIKGQRDVYFEEKYGFVPTFVYDGDLLAVGNIIKGPAIVEQRTTTTVVPPDARLEVTTYGDYLMMLE